MGTRQKLQGDELFRPGSRIREGVATGHSGLEGPLVAAFQPEPAAMDDLHLAERGDATIE